MKNKRKLLLAALVIISAMSANGCGLLEEKNCSCSPYGEPCFQPVVGDQAGGSWQWVPNYPHQQTCYFPANVPYAAAGMPFASTSIPYTGLCAQCGRGMIGTVGNSPCVMPAPQYVAPASPMSDAFPAQQPAGQTPLFTRPQFKTPATKQSVPFPEIDVPDVGDAMDQFPDESHSDRDDSLEPERGELPPPKEFPSEAQNPAAQYPTTQGNVFPILISPNGSMEPAGYQDAIFYPMPDPKPASSEWPIYPRTEGSGPEEWIQFRQSQSTSNQY